MLLPRRNAFRATFGIASHRIQSSPRRSFVNLPLDRPIEEEILPHYESEQYYPVNIEDVLNERYQVKRKLGFGGHSTTWLCRDLQYGARDQYVLIRLTWLRNKKFVALKVAISLRRFPTATDRELKIYEHLASIDSDHPGQSLIREVWDSFELASSAGKHCCLVHEPMQMTILEMMSRGPKVSDPGVVKWTLRRLLLALDFLHTEADTIHLDLKTDNLMLDMPDRTMLPDFVDEEIQQPSPRKRIDESRNIYQSQQFRFPSTVESVGEPTLCDFGEARIGKIQESGPFLQPDVYRAPEIIFEMPWGSPVDIWNVGCLIWDLVERQPLFGDIFDDHGGHDPFKHLAMMAALIGPPPSDFVRRSETTTQCFDHTGAWIAHDNAAIPPISLECLETRFSGPEKERFLEFVRSMLKWLPEQRKTAKQLLDDPWLLDDS